jgi:hypothetical protein
LSRLLLPVSILFYPIAPSREGTRERQSRCLGDESGMTEKRRAILHTGIPK